MCYTVFTMLTSIGVARPVAARIAYTIDGARAKGAPRYDLVAAAASLIEK